MSRTELMVAILRKQVDCLSRTWLILGFTGNKFPYIIVGLGILFLYNKNITFSYWTKINQGLLGFASPKIKHIPLIDSPVMVDFPLGKLNITWNKPRFSVQSPVLILHSFNVSLQCIRIQGAGEERAWTSGGSTPKMTSFAIHGAFKGQICCEHT